MASILLVCTGNVCRSPVAEGFVRTAFATRSPEVSVSVSSAGTMGWEGSRADPRSIHAALERGTDISGHVARVLTTRDVERADLVIGMAPEHRVAAVHAAPAAAGKVFTLKQLVRLLEALPASPGEGPDGTISARVEEADALRETGAEGGHDDEEIADPLGMPLEAFRAMAEELDTWCGRLVDGLLGRAPARTSATDGD